MFDQTTGLKLSEVLNELTSGPPPPLSNVKAPPVSGMKMGRAVEPLPPPSCALYTPFAKGIDFVPFGPVTLTEGPALRLTVVTVGRAGAGVDDGGEGFEVFEETL